eukprot:9486656-Pyramimonas_sp.AAC.2
MVMVRFPRLTIRLEELPQNFRRQTVLHIPFLLVLHSKRSNKRPLTADGQQEKKPKALDEGAKQEQVGMGTVAAQQ